MQAPRTEARCRIEIQHKDGNGTRPLTSEEFSEFVSDFADHLLEDQRTIDPVVFGDAGAAEIEVVFELARPIGKRDTSVEVFDIVHDAGKALGAEWFNGPMPRRQRRRAPSASTMLIRRSQQIEAAGLVDA